MKKSGALYLMAVAAVFSISSVKADTLADWTFQSLIVSTSNTNTSGAFFGYSPEVGSGTASGSHAVTTVVYSTPAGNGSTLSLSANHWSVNDYWEFSVSTLGYSDIALSFDQNGSATGPAGFQLEYSTDGSSFTNFGSSYTIPAGVTWTGGSTNSLGNTSFSYDLSSVTALDDASTIYFRLVDDSGTAINGSAVGTTGTDRVDNFLVTGTATPEPTSLALAAIGGLLGFVAIRRKR